MDFHIIFAFQLLLLHEQSEGFSVQRRLEKQAVVTPQQSFLPRRRRKSSQIKISKSKPHIMFILLDDLGWSEAGFNHNVGHRRRTKNVPTPNIDSLAADGVTLKRHYVHKFCSPTRSAIQTGRDPIHVTVQNTLIEARNPDDPMGGYAGIPRNMTTIAAILRGVGYKTHIVGKWDVGVATDHHLPVGRGYDTSLVYFEHGNDAWNFQSKITCGTYYDLWEHDINDKSIPLPGRPAVASMNAESCSYEHQMGCVYEDLLFERRVEAIISNHEQSNPLFLFWSSHAVHGPYQPPRRYEKQVSDWAYGSEYEEWFMGRLNYYGALAFIDGAIGRVVHLLKAKGLYENMLIVLSTDNGGVAGTSNEPLRGAKFTNWEGGIRAASCVSGGYLPKSVRGSAQHGLIGAQDWFATFAHIAGASPKDNWAAASNLPPVDSINVWPLLSGETDVSPREKLVIGTTVGGYAGVARHSGEPIVGGMIKLVGGKLYKLILGDALGQKLECGTVFGPEHRDVKDPDNQCPLDAQLCGDTPETGCLFDIHEDPREKNSVALNQIEVFDELLNEIHNANTSVYKPWRGEVHQEDCTKMNLIFGGYLGPFAAKHKLK